MAVYTLRPARLSVEGQAQNQDAFVKAFDTVTAACNSCHQATNSGFNVVRRPADRSWFSNQDFAPGSN